jgi:DNA invertase Pin-like site-specific DNA recombinase
MNKSIMGISLDNQEKSGINLATKMGCDYEVFVDAGLSATTPFHKRPAFNLLINKINEKKIQGIYVTDTDIDRLSRGDLCQAGKVRY